MNTLPVIITAAACAAAVTTAADSAALPIGPTRIPFYTGNLSVRAFMSYWGTHTGPIPAIDWASPERIEALKRISVFADCDYQSWALAEPGRDRWDFSLYQRNAEALRAAGIGYIVFSWVHFPPRWFVDSPDFVPYECAEHGEKLMQLSPWAPNVWDIYRRFYAAQHRAMGADIDWIRIATPSDYGEVGYPAAMTSWLVPQDHAHPGYWCGDPYAREDFRRQMRRRFRTLSRLNARWGTEFESWNSVDYPDLVDERAAAAARESGRPTDIRRWLDFVEWYCDVWVRFVPRLAGVIREFYPDTPLIVSIGYASELTKHGNDYSAVPKMARQARLALQTPGNVPYYALKRVSTACHFYGCPYYTEPPGDVPPDAEVARVFNDVSNGVQVYFEYPQNLDRARTQLRAYKNHMTGARPLVDLAIFNPTVEHRLQCGVGSFPAHAYGVGTVGRDLFDYDVVDEYLIRDGALRDYRVVAYVQGTVTEEFALRAIADWVRRGGVLVTADLGDVRTVEGDTSIWQSLVPERLPETIEGQEIDWTCVEAQGFRRLGKGLVIRLPLAPERHEELARAINHLTHNLSALDGRFANAPLIDGVADGIEATLLPDRILYFNGADKPVLKRIDFREADWEGRKLKPASMSHELDIRPHSIAAVMLDAAEAPVQGR